jgi:predicted Zn-dependent protease
MIYDLRFTIYDFKIFILTIAVFNLLFISPSIASSEDFRKRPSQKAEVKVEQDDVKAEIQFGRNVAARILGRYNLYDNERLARYINLVGKGLALHSGRTEIDYHFAVIETDSINAYSAPGGYIFLTRGALDKMKDESELAAVLAHEIAHVTERHIVKELNIHGTEKSPVAGFARLVGGSGDPAKVAFFQTVDKAVEILFEKGLKIQDEYDADRVGALLLANTGYDPSALKRYLERIKEVQGEDTKVLNKTHPSFEERVKRLEEIMKTEGLTGLNYPKAEGRFIENVKAK